MRQLPSRAKWFALSGLCWFPVATTSSCGTAETSFIYIGAALSWVFETFYFRDMIVESDWGSRHGEWATTLASASLAIPPSLLLLVCGLSLQTSSCTVS